MPKLQEPTDTWSGTGQPDVIGQWGKMRLVHYQARGPRRHPVPVLIVSPLLAKPYVLDLAPGLSLGRSPGRAGLGAVPAGFRDPG
jgi:poly(3-hydroxyalkanoate) synthetase